LCQEATKACAWKYLFEDWSPPRRGEGRAAGLHVAISMFPSRLYLGAQSVHLWIPALPVERVGEAMQRPAVLREHLQICLVHLPHEPPSTKSRKAKSSLLIPGRGSWNRARPTALWRPMQSKQYVQYVKFAHILQLLAAQEDSQCVSLHSSKLGGRPNSTACGHTALVWNVQLR